VESYLRSHPKVTHVVFSLGLLNVGVPAALKTAGITGKHIVVNVGDAQNYQYIQSGLTDGAMALNSHETAWLQVDALARHFTGQSMAVDQSAVLPNMLVTKDNLPLRRRRLPDRRGLPGAVQGALGTELTAGPPPAPSRRRRPSPRNARRSGAR
jgi:ABC-type sugar transport system substrate-binding protein